MTDTTAPVHVSVVLDRSGSMASIADDIVGGFNEFLGEQRKKPGEVTVTLVQFDSDGPFELIIDAVVLREVIELERSAFQPRGLTPLYDAVGRMIGRVDSRVAKRAELGLVEEDQIVVIITDGLENASSEHTRDTVFQLIEQRRKDGWAFVFLGANQDVYASGAELAIAPGNRAAWAASPQGSQKMWKDLSYSTGEHRSKPRTQRRSDADEFFKEDPGRS